MTHNKAELWDLCMKNNIFEGIQNNMLPKVQEIFEDTVNNNDTMSDVELLKLIHLNIKAINTINYKDLLPKQKIVDIKFNDDIQDEPLLDIDKILEEKQKERNLFSLDNSQNSIIDVNPLTQNYMAKQEEIEKVTIKENDTLFQKNMYKILENQNDILVKILQSQIKILEYLQKK